MFLVIHHPASTIALLTSLASICLAAAPPKPIAPDVRSSNIPITTTTFADIDPRFEVHPIFWGPKIQSMACLMNAVNALTNMALQDIRAPMGKTTYELADHPNSAITLLPENWQQRGQIERRFAVWGLFLAVYAMSTTGNYHCNTFHLLWDDKEVGTLGFSKGIITQSPSNTSDPPSQGLLTLDNTTTPSLLIPNTTASTSNTPILRISILFLPAVLPLQNFFMTVLSALAELAAFRNKDTGLEHFTPDAAPVPASVAFYAWRTTRKVRVPLITARHIIETLGHLPALMLERRKFSEADIMMKIDGMNAGLGRLRNVVERGEERWGWGNGTVA
jgi:hypothetical protein